MKGATPARLAPCASEQEDRLAPTPLAVFNGLMPKDRASMRLAEAVPYGEHGRQRLDVYAPRRSQDGPWPVIVFFYGGGWQSGQRSGYAFAARALAALGFVVIVPDHRLVPENRFPDFLIDCADAFRWARRHVARLGGKADSVVLLGHSAGAYNAAMLALDPRWLDADRSRIRGLVTMAGPFDFLPLDDRATIAAFGHWPTPADTQPIHHATSPPPALILHGEQDVRVKPRHSRRLARQLADAGGDVRLKIYPGIGHVGIITALARPLRHRAPVLRDIAAFARDVTMD